MPKFSLKAKVIAVDDAKFYKYFQEGILKAMRVAAIDFAMVAAEAVPVYSGMARGSFLANVKIRRESNQITQSAKQFLGLTDSPGSIEITSKLRVWRSLHSREIHGKSRKRKYRLNPRYFLSGVRKDKDAGARSSTYRFDVAPNAFNFYFESRVAHFQPGAISANWPTVAFIQGEAAFKRTLAVWLPRAFPKPEKYITKVNYQQLKGKVNPLRVAYTRTKVAQIMADRYALKQQISQPTMSLEQAMQKATIEYTPGQSRKYRRKRVFDKHINVRL